MTKIDTATVPPKMNRIERLMHRLENPAMADDDPSINGGAMREARQIILDLLGMSDKPRGEQIYDHWLAAQQPEEPQSLRNCLLFLKAMYRDAEPADDTGRISFGRALIESAIESMSAELKRQEQAGAIDHRELLSRYIEHVGRCEGTDFVCETWRGYSPDILNDTLWAELSRIAAAQRPVGTDQGPKPGDDGL